MEGGPRREEVGRRWGVSGPWGVEESLVSVDLGPGGAVPQNGRVCPPSLSRRHD